MPPKKIRNILIGLALVLLVVWGYFRNTHWSGLVIDAAGKPIEGVTALMVNGPKVVDITATDSDGKFSFKVGMKADPALRVVLCKVMYEPSPLIARATGSEGGKKPGTFTLALAKPDTIDPGVEKIVAGLPPECQ